MNDTLLEIRRLKQRVRTLEERMNAAADIITQLEQEFKPVKVQAMKCKLRDVEEGKER